MFIINKTHLLSVLSVCLLSLSTAQAHDPGMSQAEISIGNKQVSVHLTFAEKDLHILIDMDSDLNKHISAEEFKQAKPKLEQMISHSFQLSSPENTFYAEIVSVSKDDSEAIHFNLQYQTDNPKELHMHSTLFSQLSLGHRQFVKITKGNELIATRLLSSRNPSFMANLPKREWLPVFQDFVLEGIWHIWIGYDHILFLITLLLPCVLIINQQKNKSEIGLKTVFLQTGKVVTAFTLAHSLTLALSVFDMINLSKQIVEPFIALSVIIAAFNNIFNWVSNKLWLMAFAFGLVHGLGFASVLQDIGLHSNQILALSGFNLGVEIGQIAIIAVILPFLYSIKSKKYYHPFFMQRGSWAIATIASVWLVDRLAELSLQQPLI